MLKNRTVVSKIPLLMIFIFSLFSFTFLYSANEYDPSVLFLVPDKVNADNSLQNEIDSMNVELNNYFNSGGEQEVPEGLPENFKQMVRNQIEFVKDIDVYSYITYFLQQKTMDFVTTNFECTNLLFLSKHEKASKKKKLSELASEENVQFVVCFPKVEFRDENGIKSLELEIKVYDKKENSIVLKETYILNSENPGLEFACNDGTLYCCINNAVRESYKDLVDLLFKSN